jgi:hypothetical protein
MRASTAQAAATISTIILHANALVVINGKKRELETKSGTNGIIKSPIKIIPFRIFLFMRTSYHVAMGAGIG